MSVEALASPEPWDIFAMRSLLFISMRAKNPYAHAADLEADWLIIDLQDSVPTDRKREVRDQIRAHLSARTFAGRRLAVRLNELTLPDELDLDLSVCVHSDVGAFILPMLNGPADVHHYEALIEQAERRAGLPAKLIACIALLETPDAILNAAAIARSSPRLRALSLGHGDLLRLLDGSRSQESLLAARTLLVLAARAAGICAIDTPFLDIRDPAALERECVHLRTLGFDGMYAIHPSQVPVIHRAFTPSQAVEDAAARLLRLPNVVMRDTDGAMIGPPHFKQAARTVSRGRLRRPALPTSTSIVGTAPRYGIGYHQIHPGLLLDSPHELTINEGWATFWDASFPASDRLLTSCPFARALGFQRALLPQALLMNLALCLAVEPFSESCQLHLGLSDVRYLGPAYAGETFRLRLRVDAARNTSDGQHSLVVTTHTLMNEHGQRVLSLVKRTRFPALPALTEGAFAAAEDSAVDDQPYLTQLQAAPALPMALEASQPLSAGQLILHPSGRPLGISENLRLTMLLRNTHPVHSDYSRFDPRKIIVCGGFVQALTQALAGRELRQVLHEEIVHSSHLNPVAPEDPLGALSYIRGVRPVAGGLEEIDVRTLGIKGISVPQVLAGAALPLELFSPATPKPSEVEALCRRHCPELSHRIAIRIDRRLLRARSSSGPVLD